MSEYFAGRVHSIIFENGSQGFYVLRMVLDGSDPELGEIPTVRGHVSGLTVQIGTWFGFEGSWVDHAQYGRQIAISRAPVILKWDTKAAAATLAANGVGDRIVRLLADGLGDEMVDVLDAGGGPALDSLPGMTEDISTHVIGRWHACKAFFQTINFLAEAGVPRNRIDQVWSTFGDKAEEVLSTNPWALVRIDGISFPQADEVASRLGLNMAHPLRVEGAVRHVCRSRHGLGHTYQTTGEITLEVNKFAPNATPKDVAGGIAALHAAGALVIDRKTRPGTTAIYEPWMLRMEVEGARLLVARARSARLDRDPEALKAYVAALGRSGSQAHAASVESPDDPLHAAAAALRDWSIGSQVTLSESQSVGVVRALTEPVSVLTGLPGTGKTTSLRAVVQILRDAEVSFLLVAPTGIAAKRITSVTGAPASTIHRAFGAQGWSKKEREASYVGVTGQSSGEGGGSDGSAEEWGFSPESPHPADVVVCDETSMVDQQVLYRILQCTKPTARVVFIGDAAQLPSVGPGNVLRDIVACGLFPTVSLTEIYRQADTSGIVVAAHAINRGEVPAVGEDMKGSDFVLVPARTDEQVLEILIRLAERLYHQRANFQVMSPRHQGLVGVTNLNSRLRELLNPKQPGLQEMRLGSDVIREDDRVMVTRNNYDLDIYNGDVGKVSKLDRKTREATLKLHGPPLQYVPIPFKDAADHLRLAYCVTVHKMQGQESDTVVMPIVNGFHHQLQRNLLYTAITRGRRRVILVGQYEALERAVLNSRPDERNTLFLERLLAAGQASEVR